MLQLKHPLWIKQYANVIVTIQDFIVVVLWKQSQEKKILVMNNVVTQIGKIKLISICILL